MSLDQFMDPDSIKIRCADCKTVLTGTIRRLQKKGEKPKPYCRECYGKHLGRKEEKRDETEERDNL